MRIRYKHIFDTEWSECEDDAFFYRLAGPDETFLVRLVCKHEKTFVEGGIKRCLNCNDELEVTSYRD